MDVIAYIGLGSNLDNPQGHVQQGVKELGQLPQTRLDAVSPLYSSVAVGPPQPDYINAVARLYTRLAPLDLLDQLQALEQRHQRVRREHWGPRTLDLDILLYGTSSLNEPRLTVPHPFMTQRNFVLYPLALLAPELVLPGGESLAALLRQCPPDGLQRLNG